MDNSFSSQLDSAGSVLILLPTKPYFDQVAAGLSLYLSLRERKNATISCPSPLTVGFNRIIGVNMITSELGNKNLTISFKKYDAANIEKVSYDIDNGEFKLSVVPKTGFSAPQKEDLDLSYSGVSADLVILVGGANDSHFPALEANDLQGAKIVHIGTRALNSNHEVMSFAKPGATASELVASLIRDNGLNMDADVATDLVMGIEEGSNNFTSADVTPETFEIFAYLLRNGGQRPPKTKLSAGNFPPGSIPTKPFIQVQAKPQVQTPPEEPEVPQEPNGQDVDSTSEYEQDANPPEDWLQQPKIYKGTDSYSENKG